VTEKVLVSSYQPYNVKLLRLFADEHGWQPRIWFTADENRDLVASQFPDCLQYDFFDVIKGALPSGVSESNLSLPAPDELRALAEYEMDFLYMLERNDSNYSAFEYKARLAFYYRCIALWVYLLRKHEISLILFEEEPHQAADFGLYITARLLRIPTVMMTRTIADLGVLPLQDYKVGSPLLVAKYAALLEQGWDTYPIDSGVQAYIDTLNSDYQKVLATHLWDQVEEYNSLTNRRRLPSISMSKVRAKISQGLSVLSRVVLNTPIRSDQYKPGFKLETSHYTYREYIWNKLRAIRVKAALKRTYNELAVTDLGVLPRDKKIIYLALQYQPEKSTSPLAGRFVDQSYMVKFLAANAGEDWHIVVKEHPSQFIDSYTRFGECLRDANYYRELAALPNVSLMSLEFDSFRLMGLASAVASAGGTVCWEAVARGLPALTFANCWFMKCHGVFRVGTRSDLEDALSQIDSGFKPEIGKVSCFAQVVKDFGFNGAIGGRASLDYKGLTDEDNAEVHYRALAQLLGYAARSVS
jgi:hypothetical protein